MKVRVLRFVLIVVLALAVIWLRRCNGEKTTTTKRTTQTSKVNRDRGFDRRTSYLVYSKHAECRMQCRHISKAEVQEIMRDGTINYKKSDISNSRCPRYALEGRTKDDQRVRIVYAQCNESTTVVTVIDLGQDWTCHCPGDD